MKQAKDKRTMAIQEETQMENGRSMTPREAWERRMNGEQAATGSREGYETARDTLLHNATMLLHEPCFVKSDISG